MRIEVNGETVYCYTNSRDIEAEKPTVVFIHVPAWTIRCGRWRAAILPDTATMSFPVDLPGHGRSTGSPLATVEDMAAWVIAVLDALAIKNAALVGHSLGSLIALECAASHSDRQSDCTGRHHLAHAGV